MVNKESIYFYGKLAGAAKRDAERAARDAGYVVSAALNASVDTIVLGEGAPLAETRAKLGKEFDARSREAFESGALTLMTESEFYRAAMERVLRSQESSAGLEGAEQGYTPAAVAELSGASVLQIRRWHKRGLLTPIDASARLPRYSTRETLVARRLVFLTSTGLSEEFIARRLAAFRDGAERNALKSGGLHNDDAPLLAFGGEEDALSETSTMTIGDAILLTTLSTDGRELLFQSEKGPIDSRGQRRFDFTAFPTDGSFEKPESAALSEEEEQIALAERLAEWNEASTSETGRPAFLELFGGGKAPVATRVEPPKPSVKASPAELCQEAWYLECEGYYDEAIRSYRKAALQGAHEPGLCYRLGKLLYLLGDYSAAKERFYCVLELEPSHVDAKLELAKTCAVLQELDDAKTFFFEALEEKENDPGIRLELGKLYLRLNDRSAAEKEFQYAVKLLRDKKLIEDVERLLEALRAH